MRSGRGQQRHGVQPGWSHHTPWPRRHGRTSAPRNSYRLQRRSRRRRPTATGPVLWRTVDHDPDSEVHGVVRGGGRAAALREAPGEAGVAASAAALGHAARAVEALLVPGAGRGEGEAPVGAGHLRRDLVDAPGTFVARVEGFGDLGGAAIEVAGVADRIGDGDAVGRLRIGHLLDAGVEGSLGAERLRGGWSGGGDGGDGEGAQCRHVHGNPSSTMLRSGLALACAEAFGSSGAITKCTK